jgi:hypothetical protein
MNDEQTTRPDDEKALRVSVKRTIDWFRDKRIRLFELPLEIEHDGVMLRGRIYYWSKDWFVVLEEPVFAFGPGLHLMYMIPVKYVAPGEAAGEGLVGRVLPGAEVLVETYQAAIASKS